MLKDLVPLIQKITEGESLSAAEAERAFTTVEAEDEACYHYFTLLASLHTKGETSDELLGFCHTNQHFVPPFDVGRDADSVIDLSGTGGDQIKTPNISSAAAFVVASRGITVIKQAFFAVTGLTGSADLMQNFGVDPLMISREGKERLKAILDATGMLIYHANSMANPEIRKGYFSFWLKKVPEIGLSFRTAYHLAANAYSPIPMRKRVYGVFHDRYLKPLAELFQKMGYRKGLVFHGVGGLDEVSNIGPTKIVEFSTNGIKEYSISPSDAGLGTSHVDQIRGVNRETNILDFLRIIYGKEKGPKRDLVLMNAAAAFYAMDQATNWRAGVNIAAGLIDDGKVSKTFEKYVKFSGDLHKLETLKRTALA